MTSLGLHNLKPAVPHKARKRVGRGNAAGSGTYAGRGIKGQKARSGGSIRPGFEGGRTSLIRQTPKRRGKGFRSLRPEMQVIKVSACNVFGDGEIVSPQSLKKYRLIRNGPVKIVAGGDLKKQLKVAVPVSASAKKKIEQAGGTVKD